jgi:hypothetical protein
MSVSLPDRKKKSIFVAVLEKRVVGTDRYELVQVRDCSWPRLELDVQCIPDEEPRARHQRKKLHIDGGYGTRDGLQGGLSGSCRVCRLARRMCICIRNS